MDQNTKSVWRIIAVSLANEQPEQALPDSFVLLHLLWIFPFAIMPAF
jgi:hypothetical protein